MSRAFVDTSGFYALVDRSDRNHLAARRFLKSAAASSRGLVTSTYVLDEALTLIRMRVGHTAAVTFGERLAETSWCRTIDVDGALRAEAWRVFVRFADQTFSFTNCTSFAVMRALDLTEAFTFDGRDFRAAGFTPLPRST